LLYQRGVRTRLRRRRDQPARSRALYFAALVLPLALVACGDGSATFDAAPDAEGDAGLNGQGSTPRGEIAINEVKANGPDWIELANRGSQAIDVSGWFVTDSPDRLDHYYAIPGGTTIQPGGYLVIACDEVHAPFKLGLADGAYLIEPNGLTADSLLYLAGDDGTALARVPDREGLFYSVEPTPDAANPEVLE
jgi:hypothetical protein